MEENTNKIDRILDLNTQFLEGIVVNKKEAALKYHVNLRTIQRDIEYLRSYYAEKMVRTGENLNIIYERSKKGYVLQKSYSDELSNGEALAISKILLESRAFTKEEMFSILDKVVNGCVPNNRKKLVNELIRNEEFYYIPLQHNKPLIDSIWQLGQAIISHNKILLNYSKMDGKTVERIVKPVGILFSEFYFYLIAFLDDDCLTEKIDLVKLSPAIYRVDRIKKSLILKEHFEVPYQDRFQEGEFRKRVQFMYGGPLRKVRFEYSGLSIEAVLDRLPTAVIENENNGIYTISAEVFGNGINMWFGSQGDKIKIL